MQNDTNFNGLRIKELIETLGISQRAFCNAIDTDYANMNCIVNGKRNAGRGIINKILQHFPNVNRRWLQYGEGEMFLTHTNAINGNIQGNNVISVGDNTTINNTTPAHITTEAPAEEVETLPIIPRHIYEDTDIDVLEYVTENVVPTSPRIQQLPPYSMCYQVYSDELTPEIVPGDRLYIKAHTDIRKIIDGKPYVLETSTNGLMLRTLYKGDTGVRATAKTQKYRDEYIPYEDIVRVYRILGMLRANL